MFWIILSIILFGLCVFFGIVAYRYAQIVFEMEDRLDDSLEVLDSAYRNMGEILERPLFYDSPEIRTVINEIGKVRESLLYIGNNVVSIGNENIEDDDDE